MFGKNEIVGQSYFKDAREDQLLVTSMFFTLQGEGPYRGEPAFFIRLAKCNLNCKFCDTFFDAGDWMSFDDIERSIDLSIDQYFSNLGLDRPSWATDKMKMVLVITGGEPTLQKNLGPFLEKMSVRFEKTQIESNGIVNQPTIPNSTTIVISPKCLERDGVPVKYLKPNPKNLEVADCLKFVMNADPNSPYSQIPDWALEWREQTDKPIFISPMNIYNDLPKQSKEIRNSGTNDIDISTRSTVDEVISFWEPGLLNMEENKKNHEYTAKYCIQTGCILNLQIHLYASLA